MKPEELLKKHIKKKFGTIKEFCKLVNIPYSTLSFYLNRDLGDISLDKYFRICDALDLSPDDLYLGKLVSQKKKEQDLKRANKFKEDYLLLSDYDKGLIDTVIDYQLKDRRVKDNDLLIAASGLNGTESEEDKQILKEIIEETSE